MTDETQLPAPEDGLLDLSPAVAENARLLIFGPILAGLAALGIAFIIPPTFTATTRILPPQQQQGAAAMLASRLGGRWGVLPARLGSISRIWRTLTLSSSRAAPSPTASSTAST